MSPAPRRTTRARSRKAPAAAPVRLPVAPRTAWRLILGSVVILGGAAALTWAMAARVPEKAVLAAATSGSEAGFVVRQVEISGAVNQPRLSIYREVLDGGSDSMLLTDLPAMQARLKALPWVKDVSIQRRWPDRLEITVQERRPAALWQQHGRIRLIDADGELLPAEDLAPFARLPLLVGAGAREQAASLLQLISDHPELAEDMRAALWVGQRRWDIRMKSGETISLPEGPAARLALARFADAHRDTPLLGRGFVRFDLRIPDKMVVRVGGEPGQPARPRPEPRPPTAVPPQAGAPAGAAPQPGSASAPAQPVQTARISAQPGQTTTAHLAPRVTEVVI